MKNTCTNPGSFSASDSGKMDGCSSNENFVHCALLGDEMVGKTCIILSYVQQLFDDNYTTTVFDNYSAPVEVGGENFAISLFDTRGHGDYESLRAYMFETSEVLVLCFSVTDRESFYNVVNTWLPEIQRHTTKQRQPLLLVGTQIDQRSSSSSSCSCSSSSSYHYSNSAPSSSSSFSSSASSSSAPSSPNGNSYVTTEEGRHLAEMIGADCYIECSARSREGLQQVFEHVVFSALKYRRKKNKILNRLFGNFTLTNPLKSLGSRRRLFGPRNESCY